MSVLENVRKRFAAERRCVERQIIIVEEFCKQFEKPKWSVSIDYQTRTFDIVLNDRGKYRIFYIIIRNDGKIYLEYGAKRKSVTLTSLHNVEDYLYESIRSYGRYVSEF